MSKSITFCKSCCLTSNYPNIKFNNGVCNYCNEFNYDKYKKNLTENKMRLQKFLEHFRDFSDHSSDFSDHSRDFPEGPDTRL